MLSGSWIYFSYSRMDSIMFSKLWQRHLDAHEAWFLFLSYTGGGTAFPGLLTLKWSHVICSQQSNVFCKAGNTLRRCNRSAGTSFLPSDALELLWAISPMFYWTWKRSTYWSQQVTYIWGGHADVQELLWIGDKEGPGWKVPPLEELQYLESRLCFLKKMFLNNGLSHH